MTYKTAANPQWNLNLSSNKIRALNFSEVDECILHRAVSVSLSCYGKDTSRVLRLEDLVSLFGVFTMERQ